MKILFLLALALVLTTACREYESASPAPAPPTLAVEYEDQSDPPGLSLTRHLNIAEGTSEEISFIALRPLAGATNRLTDGSLNIVFSLESDKVIAHVYAIPPDTDPLRYKDGHKRLLDTHSARLNETFSLDELKKIGYTPYTIKVVKATPPQTAHPALSSKAPSVQIAITEAGPPLNTSDDAPSCNVVLHNLSSKSVMAYFISANGGLESSDPYGKSIIDPGKDSRPEQITFGRSSDMTPRGRVENPPKPQQATVEAVLFTDGSFEGEPSVAAQVKTRQIANLAIYRLVTPVIDRIVADSSLNDNQRVARVKEEIYRISSGPDQPTMQFLQTLFPGVAAADLSTDLTRGRDAAKNGVWSDLYGYMNNCCEFPPPDHISVAEWWRRRRTRIQPLLNSSN